MTPIVCARNLGKCYYLGKRRNTSPTLREALVDGLRSPFERLAGRGACDQNTLWALHDVNFDVAPGEVIGIVGQNGAGKSTLLKILSRITKPSTGEVRIHGRVGSLLEVGTGFHSDLTGRENVFLNGIILGMKHAEVRRKFDEIVAFSEVGSFLDIPVKHYSLGMYLRLAFSVAIHLEPEVLLLDEVIAVGDVSFQEKCFEKMKDVSRDGRTIFYVSHNMSTIRDFCQRAFLIESGQLAADGDPTTIVDRYLHGAAHKHATNF